MTYYITLRAKDYYFNDPNIYEAGENEKWLAEKAKELGIPDLQAAAKLIASGKMEGIEGSREYETTMVIKLNGSSPCDYNPRFISSRSRDTVYDEPFICFIRGGLKNESIGNSNDYLYNFAGGLSWRSCSLWNTKHFCSDYPTP